jgi:hypothetical protein
MRYLENIALKIIWTLCKIIPRNKEYITSYIYDFVKSKYLKKLNLKEIIWCFFKGFLPKEYFAYDLSKNDYKKYIPALDNTKKASLNGDFNYLLGNKIMFERHMQTIINGIDYLHVIENIGYFEGGYLNSLNKEIVSGEYYSLIPFLERNDLILKPISGSRGRGILFLEKEDDHYLLDSKKLNWEELTGIFKNLNNYLIQEKFIQFGFSNNIYSGSLNTMRICTMINPVTKHPFIAYAVHRFGSLESGYKDNFSQGGIAALIDINGKLSKGISLSNEGKIELYESHPLSTKPIYNEQITNWENFTKILIEMAGKMSYLKHVGWDIILSNNELYILEGNVGPDLDLIQIHKPLSEIESAWNFFQHYEFI